MSKAGEEVGSSARYYANQQEQKILIQGLQTYFSLPERSQTRNRVAKDVSNFLRCFSPHWTHRAVRLWFNNNKHTYLPQMNQAMEQGTQDPSQAKPAGEIQQQPFFPQIFAQQGGVAVMQQMQMQNAMRRPVPGQNPGKIENPPIPIQMPAIQIQNPQAVKPGPIQNPPIQITKPPTPVQNPPIVIGTTSMSTSPGPSSISPIQIAKSPSTIPTSPIQLVKSPGTIQNPPIQIGKSIPGPTIAKPVSFWQTSPPKDISPDQSYIPLRVLLNELRRSPDCAKQINDFDAGCLRIISKFGSIDPEKIEPMFKYVKFPLQKDPSMEFRFDIFNDLGSSSSLEFAPRLPSFTSQMFDPREIGTEQFGSNSIWQTRSCEDKKVMSFEAACVGDECAAFVATPFSSSNRTIYWMPYKEPVAQWSTVAVETPSVVEAMCINGSTGWVLSDGTVCKVPFTRASPCQSVKLPVTGSGCISPFADGAMTAFSSSSNLFFTNSNGVLGSIRVPYSGVMCLTEMGGRIAAGVSGSCTARLISTTGQEERAFIGHCGQVMGVERLSDTLFASRGDDQTVRVWDIRDSNPCSTLLLPGISVMSMAGSSDYLICAFHNKSIGVVDLRKDRGKAILGVQTQDYVAVSMKYDQRRDSLEMFGVVDKDQTANNSMVFVDNDGQSRQRIFRRYAGFVGLEIEGN